MKQFFKFLGIVMLLSSCGSESNERLSLGRYRAKLLVQDGQQLPFVFEVKSPTSISIINGDESITTTEITYFNDSVRIQLPVFEGYFKAALSKSRLEGLFITEGKDRQQQFYAERSEATRFPLTEAPAFDVTGIWEITFTEPDGNTYPAMGVFDQTDAIVKGTIRTNTGDYRFLEGAVVGKTLELSVFDSAHAFLFKASLSAGQMQGVFYSGNHYKETFEGYRNANFELADPEQLTYLKEGYESFEFEFPDESGRMVNLSDERFKDKVVIVQLMGTWCPNCLDESKFLSSFYKTYQEKGLEVVALTFEYVKTVEKANANLKRLKTSLDISYPLLLAQYGSTDKVLAQEKLPMLNKVWSYPTTIVLDRNHQVRKIHTGYNGPATGQVYIDFVADFTAFVEQLLDER